MMAGEIGASVIVVKEIEVPAALVSLTGQETDSRNSKRSTKRGGTMSPTGLLLCGSDSPASTAATELETDPSTTDTDFEDESPQAFCTDPELFDMDPEPNPVDGATVVTQWLFELEIASVYKPRPVRRRPVHPLVGTHRQSRVHHKRAQADEPPHSRTTILAAKNTLVVPKAHDNDTSIEHGTAYATQTKQQAKQVARRFARDRRREERKKAAAVAQIIPASSPEVTPVDRDGTGLLKDVQSNSSSPEAKLVSSLEALHVDIQPVFTAEPGPLDLAADASDGMEILDITSSDNVKVEEPTEPRLIVEALVVRKLSLEDSFLDFGGFSLI